VGEEDNIKQRIVEKFVYLNDKVRVQRERRMYAEVAYENFAEVFDYAVKNLGFVVLCTITGLDEGKAMGLIYHLSRENGIVLNLHTNVPMENPVIKTITPYFPAAEAYERELVDLLGAKVEGLAEGNRYPLPDDWPANEYPLRKSWKGKASQTKPASPDEPASRGVEVNKNA